MKKLVGIVTISHGMNYGNKLQNYAIQTVYRGMGYETETIRFVPSNIKYKKEIHSISTYIKKAKRKAEDCIYNKNKIYRKNNFEQFNNSELYMSEKIYSNNNYHSINEEEYSYFSAGSDQIWNSYFMDFSPIYLLDFVSDNNKKISYAASFGVSDINPEYEECFKKNIRDFKAISVREEMGKEIVKEVCKCNAEVVLDPTLLLERSEWNKLSLKSRIHEKGKYILTYFLGEISKGYSYKIKKYAKMNNYKIIELNKISNSYYCMGPIEFISLINNAEMIFTDSFHACCFSIIYERPFWVFSRNNVKKNMNSRIDTLLVMLKLKDRKWDGITDFQQDISYEEARLSLRNEQIKSKHFIERALNDKWG